LTQRIIWLSVWQKTAAASLSRLSRRRQRFAIEWNASYRFEDDAFIVTQGPSVRAILGYPIADLLTAERRALRQI
jgi:hypothetical protein